MAKNSVRITYPGCPLTHQELAGRMVGAVDVRVAVDTRASEHAIALAAGDGAVVVDRRRMPGGDVTALTQHRHADVQHAVVGRAVRIVAGRTVLAHRRVLEQHRPAHLGVTAGAAFVDGAAGPERLDVRDGTVRVVARGAGHLSLAHGHVRHRPLGLRDLEAMTAGTDLSLRGLRELAAR